jgi:myosin heavy subunit
MKSYWHKYKFLAVGSVGTFAAVEITPHASAQEKMYSGHNSHIPYSLAVESSAQTPEIQRNKRKSNRNENRNERSHHVTRPESREEFLNLDFASRCAVAGLQLGRTKVFLRREAFDRIEAMRSEKFHNAASAIQKIVRGKICREYFQHMRNSAIIIQSAMRMKLAKFYVTEYRFNRAAIAIQCGWRLFVSRMYVFEMQLARRTAAMIIQRAYRDFKTYVPEPEGPSEEDIIRAVVAVQSMYRGATARNELFMSGNQPSPQPSPVPFPSAFS